MDAAIVAAPIASAIRLSRSLALALADGHVLLFRGFDGDLFASLGFQPRRLTFIGEVRFNVKDRTS